MEKFTSNTKNLLYTYNGQDLMSLPVTLENFRFTSSCSQTEYLWNPSPTKIQDVKIRVDGTFIADRKDCKCTYV